MRYCKVKNRSTQIFRQIYTDKFLEGWLRPASPCLPAGRRQAGAESSKYNMFYVYFLKSSKDNNLYIGRTNNIQRRLYEHNAGRVPSTKSRKPFILLNYETYKTEKESVEKEIEFKKGYKREELKKKYNL